MDLVAEMLLRYLNPPHCESIRAERIRPGMRRRLGELPGVGGGVAAYNLDRLLNRFWDYPRALGRERDHDVYHVVDHSYAHLVHALPAERTVVGCHDLDTFRSVLEPERDPRSPLFRAMTRRILSGLQEAAMITCVSEATRSELLRFGVVPPERVTVIPNGVHPTCSPEADAVADAEANRLLGPPFGVELLHVGSTIPRKRIETLLELVAAVRKRVSGVRLIRVGGDLTAPQRELAVRLGLGDAVVSLPFLDRATLAAVYRRASLLLQPSSAEGFGLPVAEAMACGAVPVVSDIPALREVGGDAASYCPVDDVEAWSLTVERLLAERRDDPVAWAAREASAVERASRFSWAETARATEQVYRRVLVGADS